MIPKKQIPLRMSQDQYSVLAELKQFLGEKTDTKTILRAIEKHIELKHEIKKRGEVIFEQTIKIQHLESTIVAARDAASALLQKV